MDLNRPMAEILAQLSQYPIRTRLSLTGTLVVARDIAHAKLKERMDAGQVGAGGGEGGVADGNAGGCHARDFAYAKLKELMDAGQVWRV